MAILATQRPLLGKPTRGTAGNASWRRSTVIPAAQEGKNSKADTTEDDKHAKELLSMARDEVESVWATLEEEEEQMGGTAPESASEEQQELRRKIEHAFSYLEEGLVEKETEIRLMVLAALCGEHLLLLGPPGTAKSELGRRLSSLCQGTFFERLLTRFSVPEELFGPLSMRSLEEDRYERHTQGYLPEANVAFIDEVFKANSAILNALLTILNERLFDNGSERLSVPLVCLLGASNELPESEELDALYDRFLFRYQVSQVSEAALPNLLSAANPTSLRPEASASSQTPLTVDDMRGVWKGAEDTVSIPDSVVQLISGLREYLQEKCEPPVYVSDRRLVKAASMLKVAAYTDGRSTVSEYDCLLLRHVLWQRSEEHEKITDYLMDQLVELKGAQQLRYLLARIFSSACRQAAPGADSSADLQSLLPDADNLCSAIVNQLREIPSGGSGSKPSLRSHLWLGSLEAQRVTQAMEPRLAKAREELSLLLEDAATLRVAIRERTPVHILALILPSYWRDFINNGAIEDVRPVGLSQSGGGTQ